MDWLRRNWPDLIIGVALVAVVALIVVTLLSGGSLASLVRRDSPPDVSLTETTSSETAPGTGAADPSAGQTADGGEAPTGTTPADSGANGADGVDVFVPGVPGEQAGTSSSRANSEGQTQTSVASSSSGMQAASGGVAQSDQANTASVGPLPEAAQDGGFRVAAGAVDSREAAASLAESYRDADYSVTVEQQGDLYLLWIGPYNTRPDADRVALRLISDGLIPDALVYTYDGPGGAEEESANAATSDSATGTSASVVSANAAASGGVAAASTTPATTTNAQANTGDTVGSTETNTGNDTATNTAINTQANAETNAGSNTGTGAAPGAATDDAASGTPAPSDAASGNSGQQYLQVGAFASDESAQPLREQLEALGLNVIRRESDAGLVRLLVGPFGAAQLAQAQTRLSAEGLTDAFPVAP